MEVKRLPRTRFMNREPGIITGKCVENESWRHTFSTRYGELVPLLA